MNSTRLTHIWLIALNKVKKEQGITGFINVLQKLPENPTSNDLYKHKLYLLVKQKYDEEYLQLHNYASRIKEKEKEKE
jgi:hypothetical protein